MTKEEYNAEPVYYCEKCLSLKIVDVPFLNNSEFCEDCNSTNINQCSIEEWEKLYKERYGISYINNNY